MPLLEKQILERIDHILTDLAGGTRQAMRRKLMPRQMLELSVCEIQ